MKYLFTFCFVLTVMAGAAQEFHCGTDQAMKKMYDSNPALKKAMLQRNQQLQAQSQRKTSSSSATYVIPMVFHVLHQGGPENILDEQVKDAVRILNRDFARQNPDTVEIIPEFKNLADSSKIQFALATLDPNGNCTNGIVHYYDTDADWNDQSATLYGYTWDPTRYLNVYVVRSITLGNGFPAVGYTYYPGTFTAGFPADAIVVLHNYIGSIGTSSSFLSRVLTHETGHWLGLAHVFGMMQTAGIDCTDDDFINDTPPTIGYVTCPNPLIPSTYQTCTPGVSENFQNYMDYSYCCRMFTKDQCLRMQSTMQTNTAGRDNLWTPANLLSTGVTNPGAICAPNADFKYDRFKICAGNAVAFNDASWGGTAATYNWSFPGGTPSTSTFSAPVVTYANPGIYSVTYSSANSAGTAPAVTKSNIITVTNGTASYITNWSDGFENPGIFSSDWTVLSTSGSGLWERSNMASYAGSFSAMLPRKNNTRKVRSALISPAVNISAVASPVLGFKVAAAEAAPNHVNMLKVHASVDCGNTWVQLYGKSSAQLITSAVMNPDFIPSGLAEWRSEYISLSSLQPNTSVIFKFEYVRDTVAPAANLYIDNINISSVTGILQNTPEQSGLSVFPNPSHGELSLLYNAPVAQKVTVTLSDLLGRTLETLVEKEVTPGSQLHSISLKNHAAGIYLLKTELDGVTHTHKLLIEK